MTSPHRVLNFILLRAKGKRRHAQRAQEVPSEGPSLVARSRPRAPRGKMGRAPPRGPPQVGLLPATVTHGTRVCTCAHTLTRAHSLRRPLSLPRPPRGVGLGRLPELPLCKPQLMRAAPDGGGCERPFARFGKRYTASVWRVPPNPMPLPDTPSLSSAT